jgi:hypothetical protein
LIAPLAPPKQLTFEFEVDRLIAAAGCAIVIAVPPESDKLQPFASNIVTE